MGLNHPILTHWLCPADQLEAFDEDPEKYERCTIVFNLSTIS